jgi:hypothetical protein
VKGQWAMGPGLWAVVLAKKNIKAVSRFLEIE